jgi:hypothetical protein
MQLCAASLFPPSFTPLVFFSLSKAIFFHAWQFLVVVIYQLYFLRAILKRNATFCFIPFVHFFSSVCLFVCFFVLSFLLFVSFFLFFCLCLCFFLSVCVFVCFLLFVSLFFSVCVFVFFCLFLCFFSFFCP